MEDGGSCHTQKLLGLWKFIALIWMQQKPTWKWGLAPSRLVFLTQCSSSEETGGVKRLPCVSMFICSICNRFDCISKALPSICHHRSAANCLMSFPVTDTGEERRRGRGRERYSPDPFCILHVWNVKLPVSVSFTPPRRGFLYPQQGVGVKGRAYCNSQRTPGYSCYTIPFFTSVFC